MSEIKIKMPNVAAVELDTVEKVIDTADGDVAMLYLYLVKCSAKNMPVGDMAEISKNLDFEMSRLDKAMLALRDAGITEDEGKLEFPPKTAPIVLREAKNQNPDLRELGTFYEKRTGRLMKKNEFSAIHDAYSRLHLPASVIMAMITFLTENGKQLTAGIFEREACAWADNGVNTIEKAEEYLQKMAEKNSDYGSAVKLLNLSGRPLSPTEDKYIKEWIEWGFEPETIQLAYDKTMVNKGALIWPYMSKIIQNWHEKGLHTREAAEKDAQETASRYKHGSQQQYNRPGFQQNRESNAADDTYSQRVKNYLKMNRSDD